jgi:arsenite methyltransferase
VETSDPSLAAVRDRVLDRARIAADDVVLDLAADHGLLSFGALDRLGMDGSVVCLDVAADHLERIWEVRADPRLSLLVGDADVVPLPDASVDVVLGRSALAATRNGADAVRELHRVLRSGGRVSLVEDGAAPIEAAELERWFADAGFRRIDMKQTSAVYLAADKP